MISRSRFGGSLPSSLMSWAGVGVHVNSGSSYSDVMPIPMWPGKVPGIPDFWSKSVTTSDLPVPGLVSGRVCGADGPGGEDLLCTCSPDEKSRSAQDAGTYDADRNISDGGSYLFRVSANPGLYGNSYTSAAGQASQQNSAIGAFASLYEPVWPGRGCFDIDPDDCDSADFEGVIYNAESNCDSFKPLLCGAFKILTQNYDLVEEWFLTTGGDGAEFAKHFNGTIKTAIQCGGVFVCDVFKVLAMGVPPGVAVCDTLYLTPLLARFSTATTDVKKCLLIDFATILAHEIWHLCGHTSESKAWSFEAWLRVKLTERLCVVGVSGCCATLFPEDGDWSDEFTLSEIQGMVPTANQC